MSKQDRRTFIRALLGHIAHGAAGSVIIGSGVARASEAPSTPDPEATLEQRVQRLLETGDEAGDEAGEAPANAAQPLNTAFFRRGGFRRGGGYGYGGFRNGGFRRGAFRNGGFRNGGFRRAAFRRF